MKRIFVALLITTSTACAAEYTPQQLAEIARGDATPNLCAATLSGYAPVVKAATEELESRHAQCDWQQAQAIAQASYARKQLEIQEKQARQANALAIMGMGAAFIQQTAPTQPITPQPSTMNCVQQGVFTNCTAF